MHSSYDMNTERYAGQILSKRTTVSLEIDVYERLRSLGQFGESFSKLVNRVLDELENTKGDLRE